MRIGSTVGSVAVAALLAACGGGVAPAVAPSASTSSSATELTEVSVADVAVDVPVGWTRRDGNAAGFAAYSWLSEAAEDGSRVAVSIDVACTPGATAAEALDAYLGGSQPPEFVVRDRRDAAVPGAESAERFTASYSFPLASTGQSTPATRHGVLATDQRVAALVIVEGVTTLVPEDVVESVLASVRFAAATDERVAACDALLPD